MFSFITFTLTIILLASRASAAVFDGAKFVQEFSAAALEFDTASYYFQDIEGRYLTFLRTDSGAGVSLSSTPSTVTLSMHTITAAEADVQSPVGTRGTVISQEDCGDNCKCISAQWVVQTGIDADINGVAYSCAIGPYPVAGRDEIHESKQLSWITPINSSSTSSTADTSAIVVDLVAEASKETSTCDHFTECCKPADWICRHPEYAKKWSQCQTKLDACSTSRFTRRSFAPRTRRSHLYQALEHRAIQKRATAITAVVHMVDHAADEEPKCLAAIKTTAFGDADGLELDVCNSDDTRQQWTITKA